MTAGNVKQRYLAFLMFVFCFVIIPGILLTTGIVYLRAQSRDLQLKSRIDEINRLFKNMQAFADPERFWCVYLNSELDERLEGNSLNETADNIRKKLAHLKSGLNFNHIVYTPQKGIIDTSISAEPKEDWFAALNVFQRRLRRVRRDHNYPKPEEEAAIGKVFGPQVNLKHLHNSHEERYFLVWPDSQFRKPLLWCKVVSNVLIVIMIDYHELNAIGGIYSFLARFYEDSGKRLKFALISENGKIDLVDQDTSTIEQLKAGLEACIGGRLPIFETRDFVILPKFIRPDVSIMGYFSRDDIAPRFNLLHLLSIAAFVLIGLFICIYSYRVFVCELPDSLSLKWKLRFLFFFANGLPLLVLFFIGTDYLNQKKDTLLQENLTRGINFLQSFDESFESEYAKILVNKRYAEEKLMKRLAHEELNEKNLMEFVNDIGEYEKKIFIVASRSETLGTEKGLYDPKRGILPKEYHDKSEQNRAQLDFTRKIGHYFVESINGTKISDKIATEIEIMVESVTQKPVVNFIFEMMQKRGNFTQWGFGQNVHPAIIDTFTLGHTRTEDYFFLAMFRKQRFQLRFLEKTIPVVNRNNLGLRVVALKDLDFTVPRNSYRNPQLREFASTLTSFPGDELKFVNYSGENHLVMGFNGNSLTEYSLIGLYPVSRIDSLIQKQKKQLSIFAILSLLVTLTLSQFLAHSFLVPLRHLSEGARAIEEKRFSHRLPEMGNDEFGKMGTIFNEVMVDLDELSVASAIQEQLLPQSVINTGKYNLFGRSVSMGELGGDYYDFIELEDGHFSVMLGDVAGHGVGAALIMAMAKAGIIQSDNLLNQPVKLISRLHSLIYNSKTKKQKKIMTFQYLYLNGKSGNCIYTNAGACSPMIVRKYLQQVEELKVAGAALGAFKKANFVEVPVNFAPGDAIVFYTDGIVEARNDAGQEMGYDNLKKLLLQSWDMDAGKFYQNIFNGYLEHLGNQGAQDDLTMIILVYTGEEKQSETIAEKQAADETVS
ncbi:MAG: SpoIIE family protein phosphatase [Candidatus Riflebacteria bacterium]